MKIIAAISLSLTCLLLACVPHSQDSLTQSAQDKLSSTNYNRPFQIFCSPNSPLVSVDENVSVQAWTSYQNTKSIKYAWSADGGLLTPDGDGSMARWILSGVKPGQSYQIIVKAKNDVGESGECAARVTIRYDDLALKGNRIISRDFLLPHQPPTEVYGLYSYLLLGEHSNTSNREKYLSTIVECLKFPPVMEMNKYEKISQKLNVTYLLVTKEPEREVMESLDNGDYRTMAEWVLQHYDYNRAAMLLGMLPENYSQGPYFLSVRHPYIWGEDVPKQYLFQDHSKSMPELTTIWVRGFLNQADQVDFWKENTLENMAIRIRTLIEVGGKGLSAVQGAIPAVEKAVIYKAAN